MIEYHIVKKNQDRTMCRFIILLLLLCNNQCCTNECSCIEPRNKYHHRKDHSHHSVYKDNDGYAEYNNRNTGKDCDCDKEYRNDWSQNREKDYMRHENCACTACEESSELSSDKSDCRTVYLNTAAVNCQK